MIFDTGADTVAGRNVRRDGRVMISWTTRPACRTCHRGQRRGGEDPAELLAVATRLAGRAMGACRAAEFGARNAVPGGLVVRVSGPVLASATSRTEHGGGRAISGYPRSYTGNPGDRRESGKSFVPRGRRKVPRMPTDRSAGRIRYFCVRRRYAFRITGAVVSRALRAEMRNPGMSLGRAPSGSPLKLLRARIQKRL